MSHPPHRTPSATALSLPILCALMLAACEPRPDDVAVEVSAIGSPAALANPAAGPMDTPSRLLIDATAQGLVRFDAAGQVEPGLAERWIVIDDGRSYIFRLGEAQFPDGRRVTAGDVVAALTRALRPASRNPLKPFLEVIDEVVEMTPQIVEIRLRRPRPDLLKLLAQPEMAIFAQRDMGGTGPFRATRSAAGAWLLQPLADPARADDEEVQSPSPADHVRLRGERASHALARFMMRQSDLVTGGTFDEWPLIGIAGVAPANLRVDPATGLFGLRFENANGFLADAANRAAIAMALDRAALTAPFASGWAVRTSTLPSQLDSGAPAAEPQWAARPIDERLATARARVQAWRAGSDAPPQLRIALPRGPGGNLMWRGIAQAMIGIGIAVERVDPAAPADLGLIDLVAPYDSARWYLYHACGPCSESARLALDAARDAPTLEARAQRLAEADRLIADEAVFVPIAQPLRWSIVATRLRAWTDNSRAWHPLSRLRNPPR